MKKILSLFCLLLLPGLAAMAREKAVFRSLQTAAPVAFEENKGQLADENGNQLPQIQYYARDKGTNIYLSANKLLFVFVKAKYPESYSHSVHLEAARMEMELLNASLHPEIQAEEPENFYSNYQLPGNAGWANGVRSFKKLTCRNIYPAIDLVLESRNNTIEYSFVVRPGGDPADIKIRWNGANETGSVNGNKKYKCTLGEIEESDPYSFTQEGGPVASRFSRDGNISSFALGYYDPRSTLVIDPVLRWATYFGDNNNDLIYGTSTDNSGNVYITGSTLSTKGIASAGAYQASLNGNADAFIARYNTFGDKIWSSYYGGEEYDAGSSVALDAAGNIYIAGVTKSLLHIATSRVEQPSFAGHVDAFLAKFNTFGLLQWGTYYGGDSSLANKVVVDGSNNIIIAGYTNSNTLIASSGAFQPILGDLGFRNEKGDGFLAKFNPMGTRIWGTYFGGDTTDCLNGVTTDKNNNIYVVGYTKGSKNLATSGAFQPNFGGIEDGLFAKFSPSGNLMLCSYIGGAAQDYMQDIISDGGSRIYLGGNTASMGMASPLAFKTTLSSSAANTSDGFLASFDTAGARQWAIYYGGPNSSSSNNTVLSSLAYDAATANVYSAGITNSESGIATSGAYQTVLAGDSDAFITSFSPAGARQWASYFGGSGNEKLSSLSVNKNGTVFLAGVTVSTTGIATQNANQSAAAGGADGFLAKFSDCISKPLSLNGPSTACANINFLYTATRYSGISYSWTATGGSITSGQGTDSVKIAWQGSGAGKLMVVGSSSEGCSDTTILNINILPSPLSPIRGNNQVCAGFSSSYAINKQSGASRQWKVSGGTIQSGQGTDSIVVNWTTAGAATVVVSGANGSGCNDTAKLNVTVNAVPVPSFSGGNNFCMNTLSVLTSPKHSGSSYFWVINKGTVQSGQNTDSITVLWTATGAGSIRLIETNAGGCRDSFTRNVIVNALPIPVISGNHNICPNAIVVYKTAAQSGNSYKWSISGGSIAAGQGTDSVSIQWASALSGSLKLVETNSSGCKDSVLFNITLSLPPKADFSFSGSCPGDSTFFTDNSSGAASYLWKFGDGNVSTKKNPGHLFAPGIYRVTHLAFSAAGCADSVSKNVEVRIPDARWTVVHQDKSFSFRAEDTTLSSYEWMLGDGKYATVFNPTHIYTYYDTFRVRLTVTSAGGCIASHDSLISFVNAIESEQVSAFDIGVYPNPFDGQMNISYTLPASAQLKMEVYSVTGQQIAELQNGIQKQGNHAYALDATQYGLQKGVYILKISINGQVFNRKLIKL
jgi:hypothetical protein